MHDKTLSASPWGDFPPTTEFATVLGISRVFWGYFLVVLNWFHHLFSEFLQESKLVGILVFHTSTPCFFCLVAFVGCGA
jgi:hypothetical protein